MSVEQQQTSNFDAAVESSQTGGSGTQQPGAGADSTQGAAQTASAQTHAATSASAGSDERANPRRMLYRHPTDSVLGGVCGGLADFFGWDSALIRILWVILTLATSGGGLLAYLALWILLPVGTVGAGQERPATVELNERNLGRAAWLLIGLGVIWLLGNVGILPWIWGGFWRIVSVVFWPVLLIGVGYVLLRYIGKTNNWRSGLGSATGQMKSSMRERMPNRASVKSSFQQFRHKLPLKRSRTDRIWMGVCGGVGQRLGLDSNLVRLIWAAFSVGSIGMGVLLYVLAGLFLVQESADTSGTAATQLDYTTSYGSGSAGSDDRDSIHDVQIVDATSSR